MSGKKVDLSKEVMGSIKSNKVEMKSKEYFILLTALLIGSTVLVVIVTAVFLNVLVYDVQTGRDLQLERLIENGDTVFISRYPWVLTLITAGFLSATVLLARRFEWGYKHRMISIIAVAVGLVIASSILLSAMGTSDSIANSTPFRPFTNYGSYTADTVLVGEVVEVSENQMTVKNYKNKTIEITMDQETIIIEEEPVVGDEVQIVIEKYGEVMKAKGILTNPPENKVQEVHDRRLNFEIKIKRLL